MSLMLPNLPEPKSTPPQFQPDQQVPERKYYAFRWSLFVGIPLVVLSFMFVVHGIDPAVVDFRRLMRAWGIRHPEQLIKLICLLLVLTCSLITIRIIKRSSKR